MMPLKGKTEPPHSALFHNNHDGTFTDVTQKAGVANDRWGYGCAVGDFDNDGYADLYVTNFGQNRRYRNNHDGTFTDIAQKAGVTAGLGHSSCAEMTARRPSEVPGECHNENARDVMSVKLEIP